MKKAPKKRGEKNWREKHEIAKTDRTGNNNLSLNYLNRALFIAIETKKKYGLAVIENKEK